MSESKTIWKVMVEVQRARRDRRVTLPEPGRERPTTLRSIRERMIDDHYALLAASDY